VREDQKPTSALTDGVDRGEAGGQGVAEDGELDRMVRRQGRTRGGAQAVTGGVDGGAGLALGGGGSVAEGAVGKRGGGLGGSGTSRHDGLERGTDRPLSITNRNIGLPPHSRLMPWYKPCPRTPGLSNLVVSPRIRGHPFEARFRDARRYGVWSGLAISGDVPQTVRLGTCE
jgi:hypothetical protein